MKTPLITGIILAIVAGASLERAAAQPLNLNGYPSMTYTQTFDTLGFSIAETNANGSSGALPNEWSVYTNAHPTYPGSIVSWSAPGLNLNNWTNSFRGGFVNYASYFDYVGGTNWFTNNTPTTVNNDTGVLPGVAAAFPAITNLLTQTNAVNRALGIRQTGAFGDPFGAFVIKIADTVDFHNFSLALDFLNLDGSAQRTTTWTVDWGIADPVYYVPTSFYPIATYVNTAGTFHWFHTNITFPDGTINNVATPAGAPPNLAAVWIRVTTLTPSSSSGNRESFAIDNVGLSWASGSGGCVAVDGSSGAGIEAGGIISQPSSTSVYSNASATFTVSAAGTSPIFYQWYKDGVGLTDGATGNGNSSILGSRSYQILINSVGPADQGHYSCVISNSCGSTVYVTNSASATFAITNPPAVSIAYLRSLVDSHYVPTPPTTAFWQITGIITMLTNLTTGNTASYYIQDGTAGINLFVTGGSSFRPNPGDEVTEVGWLTAFGGNLELEADLTGAVPNNNATLVQILSNNIANYPVAKILSWPDEFAYGAPTNSITETNKKGSICILTNVYFGTNAGKVLGSTNYFCFITNSAGRFGWIEFFGVSTNSLLGKTLPSFAYSVQGPVIATDTSATITNQWNVIAMANWQDIVTSPLTLNIARSGNTSTITWTAVPQTYSYSVLAATDVAGPYTAIASNLKFSTTSGSYQDTDAANHKYYRVTSP